MVSARDRARVEARTPFVFADFKLIGALGGAPLVTSIDLSSHAVGAAFAMPRDPNFGDLYATEVHALPGSDQSVVTVDQLYVNDGRPGTSFFDNGVLRYPYSTDLSPYHLDVASIAFASSEVLYGDGNDALVTLMASPTSLTATSVSTGLIPGDGYMPVQYAGGKVFDELGYIVDPVSGSLIGALQTAGGGMIVTRNFVVSADGGRYYYAAVTNTGGNTILIQCFDTSTFALTGSISFTTLAWDTPTEIAFYGPKGLAVTVDNVLALLPNALSTPGCAP